MTLPTAITDRTGAVHARLSWNGDQLVELSVPIDGGEWVTVSGAIVDDALLGRAHAIRSGDAAVTTVSAIEWAHPTEIPAIAAPGKLHAGAGSAIMNVLATLAQRAGVTAMQSAGPYPTAALWSTLARSFRTTAAEADFTGAFLDRAARIARDPMPALFVPAPHERISNEHGHVEMRDATLERAVIDGVVYARDTGITRLVGDEPHAEVWFGDTVYAHIATLGADGSLRETFPMPACTSAVIGKNFPRALCEGLAELLADTVPAPLAMAAHTMVRKRALVWADLGARAAASSGDAIAVHAAIWERVASLGMARLALAIVEALAPVVTRLTTAALAATPPAELNK